MPPLWYILMAFVLPAAIAIGAVAIGWRWATALGFAGAFLVGQWTTHGLPKWPPGSGDAGYWIVWLIAPVAVLALLDALFRPPTGVRMGVYFVLGLIGFHLVVSNLPFHTLREVWDRQTFVYGAASVATVAWVAMEGLAEANPGLTAPIILFIQCVGTAILLVTENMVVAGHGAGTLAAISAGPVVLGVFRRPVNYSRGAVLVISFSLAALLVYGFVFASPDPPPVHLVYGTIILLAPLLSYLADLPGLGRWRLVVRVVPVLLAVGAASGISLHDYAAAAAAGQNSSSSEEE